MSKPELFASTHEFSQDEDSLQSGDQSIKVMRADAGGGHFWIIETERWAFDKIEDLMALLERVHPESVEPARAVPAPTSEPSCLASSAAPKGSV